MQSPKNNITIQDIAERLNVSASTVSRALNDHPKISKERKDAVLNMALELGYHLGMPNLLVNERSPIIGLILPTLKGGFFGQIHEAITNYCDANAYVLVSFTTNYNQEKEASCFEQLAQMNPLAFVFVTSNEFEEIPALKIMLQKRIPAVAIHESKYQSVVSTFIMDKEKCLADAIHHLSSSGVKRVLLLVDEITNPLGDQISPIFKKEILAEGMDLFEGSLRSVNDNKEFRFLLDELYSEDLKTDAIITSSYLLALKMQNFLLSKSVSKPSKILLISLDSHDISSISKPKITYTDFQTTQVSNHIMKLLHDQIDHGYKVETSIFSSRLVIQSSSLRF